MASLEKLHVLLDVCYNWFELIRVEDAGSDHQVVVEVSELGQHCGVGAVLHTHITDRPFCVEQDQTQGPAGWHGSSCFLTFSSASERIETWGRGQEDEDAFNAHKFGHTFEGTSFYSRTSAMLQIRRAVKNR